MEGIITATNNGFGEISKSHANSSNVSTVELHLNFMQFF